MSFQLFMNGLPIGSVYALVALGYSLIYAAFGLLNFSQGDVLMVGAFLGLTLFVSLKLPFPIALLLAMLGAALIGLAMERFLLRPMARRRARDINLLLATIALAIILRNGSLLIWGAESQFFPSVFGEEVISVGGLRVVPQNIWIFVTALGLVAALQLFLYKTKPGMAMRAVALDQGAARLMGVQVNRYIALSFALSCALGAAAGVLVAPIFFVSASMGAMIGLKGFVAAVTGGLGNLGGAVVGGLLLGILESMSSGLVSSGYRDAIAFLVLILLLWFKPAGLLSRHQGEKT
ncbi:MAG: branched-chain amino acid ABC transporter permease [Bacillota bacterium]